MQAGRPLEGHSNIDPTSRQLEESPEHGKTIIAEAIAEPLGQGFLRAGEISITLVIRPIPNPMWARILLHAGVNPICQSGLAEARSGTATLLAALQCRTINGGLEARAPSRNIRFICCTSAATDADFVSNRLLFGYRRIFEDCSASPETTRRLKTSVIYPRMIVRSFGVCRQAGENV
jgi:hypothetical protein